jgi:hypothetical protein
MTLWTLSSDIHTDYQRNPSRLAYFVRLTSRFELGAWQIEMHTATCRRRPVGTVVRRHCRLQSTTPSRPSTER